MLPVSKTVAPLAARYFVTLAVVEPGISFAPLPWTRLPLTDEPARVFTPEGSCPLPTRASHSQPRRPVPIVVDVPAGWVARPVLPKTVSWPCEALTTSGNVWLLLSPTYISPSSAFSGCPKARHVVVGMPLGSAPPDSTLL